MTINCIYWTKEASNKFPAHGAGTVTPRPLLWYCNLPAPALPAHWQQHWTPWKGCTNQGGSHKKQAIFLFLVPLPKGHEKSPDTGQVLTKTSSMWPTWPLITAPLCADQQTPADMAGRKII